jgi:GTP-binding protein
MIIKNIKFLGSFPSLKLCPKAELPEYAFIGRSNVGKSSLINMITGVEGLAHTSSTPGKTQHLNFFNINNGWCIVDLPGYGYARTPKNIRESFKKMTEDYLSKRSTMLCAFLLIDSCVPPQEADIDFANWMGENQVPFVLVFTKTDRKKAHKNSNFVNEFKIEFLKYWNEFPNYFISSSDKKVGREEILKFIEETNRDYKESITNV